MAKKEDESGHDTITVTEDQLNLARFAIELQAEAHNLDIEDENIQTFLEHVAQNMATAAAWDLFNSNIINTVTIQGHWAPGGCTFVHSDDG